MLVRSRPLAWASTFVGLTLVGSASLAWACVPGDLRTSPQGARPGESVTVSGDHWNFDASQQAPVELQLVSAAGAVLTDVLARAAVDVRGEFNAGFTVPKIDSGDYYVHARQAAAAGHPAMQTDKRFSVFPVVAPAANPASSPVLRPMAHPVPIAAGEPTLAHQGSASHSAGSGTAVGVSGPGVAPSPVLSPAPATAPAPRVAIAPAAHRSLVGHLAPAALASLVVVGLLVALSSLVTQMRTRRPLRLAPGA